MDFPTERPLSGATGSLTPRRRLTSHSTASGTGRLARLLTWRSSGRATDRRRPEPALAVLAATLLACPVWILAAESDPETAVTALPALELIEFLGSFETDAGEWIDPTDLMQPEFEQLLEAVRAGRLNLSEVTDSNVQPGLDNSSDNDD